MKKRTAGSFRIGKRFPAHTAGSSRIRITKRESAGADAVLGNRIVLGEREVWRISTGGKIKNIATSASSTAAMDEAMVIYGHALKRLANR